jgi:hypothetical protein
MILYTKDYANYLYATIYSNYFLQDGESISIEGIRLSHQQISSNFGVEQKSVRASVAVYRDQRLGRALGLSDSSTDIKERNFDWQTNDVNILSYDIIII